MIDARRFVDDLHDLGTVDIPSKRPSLSRGPSGQRMQEGVKPFAQTTSQRRAIDAGEGSDARADRDFQVSGACHNDTGADGAAAFEAARDQRDQAGLGDGRGPGSEGTATTVTTPGARTQSTPG